MSDLKVYLDHLIPRENLRYQKPIEFGSSVKRRDLPLGDLMIGKNRIDSIRKPDFQRATWAWTPQDCVDLIDSIVKRRVVPGIIMWRSSTTLDYILDGGHRVSVIVAWLNDSWGDSDENLAHFINYSDKRDNVKKAAQEVRKLLSLSEIGNFKQYADAHDVLIKLLAEGRVAPKPQMGDKLFEKAVFYSDLAKGDIELPVLWVEGDYNTAETSFLRINKSGKQLTHWETRLIEDRDSSFIRYAMSIASPDSAKYYWDESESLTEEQQDNLKLAIENCREINQRLFEPYIHLVTSITMPLMLPAQANKPLWVSEFLAITEGMAGQLLEIDLLIKRYKRTEASAFVDDAINISNRALDLLNQLTGKSNHSLSLGIVPALYFYAGARYVRGLFYGFIYWMFQGDDATIKDRKLIFSAYRNSFELIFGLNKDTINKSINRGVGSGTEVTLRFADTFQTIFEAVAEYKGDLEADGLHSFLYDKTGWDFTLQQTEPVNSTPISSKTRTFKPKQRNQLLLTKLLDKALICDICGGILDPSKGIQQDHIIPHSEGGETSTDNLRITHPFCNHSRQKIERIRDGREYLSVPLIRPNDNPNQLKLFLDSDFE